MERNQVRYEIFLQELAEDGSGAGKARSIYISSEEAYLDPKWMSDGKRLAYFATKGGKTSLVQYDVVLGEVVPASESKAFDIKDVENPVQTIGPGKGKPRPKILRLPSNHKISKDGRYVAFSTLLFNKKENLDPLRGVVQGSREDRKYVMGLFVLDTTTSEIKQLTPETMSGSIYLSWMPNSREIVFQDSYNGDGRAGTNAGTQIRIVNVETGGIRGLVTQQGNNIGPVLSPDGKWVAFTADFQPVGSILYPQFISVVSVETGEITRIAPGNDTPQWTPDSKSFYLNRGLRVDVATKQAYSVPGKTDNYADQNPSFSKDFRRMVFTRSSTDQPDEVYVQNLPDGEPKRLTHLADGFAFRGKIRTDAIKWKSNDGTEIPGYLLTPSSAWDASGTRTAKPLPTIAYNGGGPGWQSPNFNGYGQLRMQVALAVRGYAVLIANTRSRGGHKSYKTEEKYYRLSYEDMMSGLDHLVERGIADRTLLGGGGHSYGGNLMAYVITHTDKLRAAQMHDPTTLGSSHITLPGSSDAAASPLLYGVVDPFSPDGKRIIADLPRNNLDKIRTPTLIQVAERGIEPSDQLFKAMTRLGVPNELIGYDYHHLTHDPAPAVDNIVRVLDWFDYWLRDMPYPDKEREKAYNAWKAKRTAEKEDTAGTGAQRGN